MLTVINQFSRGQSTYIYMSFPSGDFKEPGPRIAGGVLESSERHGGLLYSLTAQRHGVLHPVCQDTVGGRTQTQSHLLWDFGVNQCGFNCY